MTKEYNTESVPDFSDIDDLKVKNVDTFILNVFEVYEVRERVGQHNNIIFSIYPNEGNHHEPHVHARFNELEISISLIDFSVIASSKNIPAKNKRYAMVWVKENYEWLVTRWDQMHQIKVRNFGRKSMLEKEEYGK